MANIDIYQVIRNDFIDFKNSPEYADYHKKYSFPPDIDDWICEYASNMTPDYQKELFDRYGFHTLFSKLPLIANNHCWNSFDDFVNNEEPSYITRAIIAYIMEEALKELYEQNL